MAAVERRHSCGTLRSGVASRSSVAAVRIAHVGFGVACALRRVSSRRGSATQFTVKGLPDPANAAVTVNNQKFTRWHVSASDAIRIEVDVDEHYLCIAFQTPG
jgi:hypothetical protein